MMDTEAQWTQNRDYSVDLTLPLEFDYHHNFVVLQTSLYSKGTLCESIGLMSWIDVRLSSI
jgi:hypothetical protein